MESRIGTLKTECADYTFPAHQHTRTQVFAYRVDYNVRWYQKNKGVIWKVQ
jgi:hypothetical protein